MRIAKLIMAVLALALMIAPAWASGTSITGTVTYRERIALPPDAWLRVTLVHLESGAPVVGASASIPARGQVPIGFALNVRSDLAGRTDDLGLIAEISQGGRVLFRNDRPQPVDLDAAHQPPILLRRQADPAPQPQEPPVVSTPDLFDIVWTATSIGGRPVVGTRPLTLSVSPDYRAGGSGGCNNYFTEASIEGKAIAFGPPAATRMACAGDLMAQEHAYFTALSAVASFEIEGNSLRLYDAAGIPLIGLVRATE
jgi:putative lipoprotein